MMWEFDNPVAFGDLARMLKDMRCRMSMNAVLRVVLNILDDVDSIPSREDD